MARSRRIWLADMTETANRPHDGTSLLVGAFAGCFGAGPDVRGGE
jgi:hypothetical protein